MTNDTTQPLTEQETSPAQSSSELLSRAMKEAEQGEIHNALLFLSQIPKQDKRPLYYSYLGYCVAHEHGQLDQGLILCRKAVKLAPHDPLCYLNLGRVCLLIGQKQAAIKAFRQSLKVGCLPQVVEQLQQLGIRKAPPIRALPRGHVLNKCLGRMLEPFCRH